MEGTRQRKAYKITKQRVSFQTWWAGFKVPTEPVYCSKPKTEPVPVERPCWGGFLRGPP
jgi:hypothetical protein